MTATTGLLVRAARAVRCCDWRMPGIDFVGSMMAATWGSPPGALAGLQGTLPELCFKGSTVGFRARTNVGVVRGNGMAKRNPSGRAMQPSNPGESSQASRAGLDWSIAAGADGISRPRRLCRTDKKMPLAPR